MRTGSKNGASKIDCVEKEWNTPEKDAVKASHSKAYNEI